MKRLFPIACLLVVSFLFATVAAAQGDHVVIFDDSASAATIAKKFARDHGGTLVQVLAASNGAVISLPASGAASAAADPVASFVHADTLIDSFSIGTIVPCKLPVATVQAVFATASVTTLADAAHRVDIGCGDCFPYTAQTVRTVCIGSCFCAQQGGGWRPVSCSVQSCNAPGDVGGAPTVTDDGATGGVTDCQVANELGDPKCTAPCQAAGRSVSFTTTNTCCTATISVDCQ